MIHPELKHCTICPQACGIDRYQGVGFCGTDHRLKINLAQLHHGEEPVLSGTRGSGTIFLSHCNLRCVFCQNHELSHLGWGTNHSSDQCAELMLRLQDEGAHNINLVSPTQYTLQLIDAILLAKRTGLQIPIVWNSNAYEEVSTLKRLRGLVDIYLPDFKYGCAASGETYSQAKNYPELALKAIGEMWDQVGELALDAEDIALKGLIIRHLVLPNDLARSTQALRLLKQEIGAGIALSLMAQYYPAGYANRHPELNRGITTQEYQEVLDLALEFDFEWMFSQELSCSDAWTPEFREAGNPLREHSQDFHGRI